MSIDSNKKVNILLILISLILNMGIFFLDEGTYAFNLLFEGRELTLLILFTVFFSSFPLGIYNFIYETKWKERAIVLSTIGYVPLLLMFFSLL